MRRTLIEHRTPQEWNIRVFGEENFYDFCDEAKISVREVQLEQPGLWVPRTRQIFLSQDLRGAEKLFVAFHELGHAWLHGEQSHLFLGVKASLEEEADAVAACALIPVTLLRHFWPTEICEMYGYPNWILAVRQRIFQKWNL